MKWSSLPTAVGTFTIQFADKIGLLANPINWTKNLFTFSMKPILEK